jgi:hypothetical protein
VSEPPTESPPAAPAGEAGSAAVSSPAPKTSEKIDKSKMSIADIVAWCRQHDAK